MKPSDFIHPEDAAAMRQLESIPGFAAFAKKLMAIGTEQQLYGVNMASSIRLSEKQLPHIYKHLPPICQRLGIAEPEFYLQMSPVPNAWTMGDTRIYITVTSALLEMMNDEELDATLAHECGHILCRHSLYHTLVYWIRNGLVEQGLMPKKMMTPVEIALMYWNRKSELSADRAACIITSPEAVVSTMARFAGGPKSITSQIDYQEWAKQGDEYEKIQQSGLWNKALQLQAIAELSHPFAAVRVREVMKWSESEQYRMIKKGLLQLEAPDGFCPQCGNAIEKEWKFCLNCGHQL